MPTFSPPTDRLYFERPLHRWYTLRGRTVWRVNGVWHENNGPWYDDVKIADVVPVAQRPGGEDLGDGKGDRYLFFGGHDYTVSSAVAASLAAAGYTTT